MCGIIGYTGSGDAVAKVKKGLGVLEYRGYDSAGIAAETADGIRIIKCGGRVSSLVNKLAKADTGGSTCAVGHTRWATHGAPTDVNAHPHRAGKTVLVHNGIIENSGSIKSLLAGEYSFLSETDTEAAAALIDRYCGDSTDTDELVSALLSACGEMKGSYAFGILFDDCPGEMYAVRRGSPLIIAKGTDGYYIASDMTALIEFTDRYCPLGEGECAVLTPDSAVIYFDGEKSEPRWQKSTITAEQARKDGHAHFMEKEMLEEPQAVRRALSIRVKDGLPDFSADGIEKGFFGRFTKIRIAACGSAMHAGLMGVHLFRDLAGIECEVSAASEYRYYPPCDVKNTLVILISQSGETADTLAALRYAKSAGFDTLAVVNVAESTIAREADRRLYTYAGPEIAVATTKGYCTQLAMLWLIVAAAGLERGFITEKNAQREIDALLRGAPVGMEEIFSGRENIRAAAEILSRHEHIFFIGRGHDCAMAEEGALKLKEISYIHAEAYPAGELKHGTISLIDKGTPVIALSAGNLTADKTAGSVREVKSRGAFVLSVGGDKDSADIYIPLPGVTLAERIFASLAAVQMLAYETAVLRGCDIDKPRNLAKSVTVE